VDKLKKDIIFREVRDILFEYIEESHSVDIRSELTIDLSTHFYKNSHEMSMWYVKVSPIINGSIVSICYNKYHNSKIIELFNIPIFPEENYNKKNKI